jgi:hypothetical protein
MKRDTAAQLKAPALIARFGLSGGCEQWLRVTVRVKFYEGFKDLAREARK